MDKLEQFTPIENAVADRINPIVLRELRHMTRSRFVISLVIGLLVIFFLISWIFLTSNVSTDSAYNQDWYDQELGLDLFSALLMFLGFGATFSIPPYVAVRFGWERSERNYDLMYISTLKPSSIIAGKLLAGLQLTLLAVAVCTPFLALTYLLRGVDIALIFISLGFLIGYVMTCTLGLMLFAAVPMSRSIRVIAFLFFVGPAWFFGSMGIILGGVEEMQYGFFADFFDVDFVTQVLPMLVLWLMSMVSAYVLTVTLISPPGANRAFPVRLCFTIQWLLSLALIVFIWWWDRSLDLREGMFYMAGASMGFWGIAFLASSGTADERSLRVQHTIPKNPLLRLLAYPYYNGRANGMVWSGGAALVSLLIFAYCVDTVDYANAYSDEPFFILASSLLFGMAYILIAVAFQRRFATKNLMTGESVVLLRESIAPGFAIIIASVIIIVPLILAMLTQGVEILDVCWSVTCPINYIDDFRGAGRLKLNAAIVWFGAGLLWNIRWIARDMVRFRPPQEPVEGEG